MKNAFLFHGTSCNPQKYWFPYIKEKLEERGYRVAIPQLPDPDIPDVNKWLPVALAQGEYTSETIIIGHSVGGPLVLSVLENIKTPIAKAILEIGRAHV